MNTSLPSGSLPARYSAARISSFGWLSANQSLALLCFPLLIRCWDIPRKSATSSIHPLFQEVAEWGGYLALPLSRRPTGHHIFVTVTRYIHTPPLIQDFIFLCLSVDSLLQLMPFSFRANILEVLGLIRGIKLLYSWQQ